MAVWYIDDLGAAKAVAAGAAAAVAVGAAAAGGGPAPGGVGGCGRAWPGGATSQQRRHGLGQRAAAIRLSRLVRAGQISLAKLYGYEDSPPRTFELERETRWLLLTPTALWHADEADGEAAEVRRAAPPPRLTPPVAPIEPGANIGGG